MANAIVVIVVIIIMLFAGKGAYIIWLLRLLFIACLGGL